MAITFPVESSISTTAARPPIAKMRFGSTEQAVTQEGVPLWRIDAVWVDETDETVAPDILRVTVASPVRPLIERGDTLVFTGMVARMYTLDSGKSGLTFSADAVEAV